MTPDSLAALHARAMIHAPPWSASAFADTLGAAGVFLVMPRPVDPMSPSAGKHSGERPTAQSAGHVVAFALGRAVADEAELLTLSVDPKAQRTGIGRSLLADFEAEAARRGAATAFLEVAEDNAPALALYRRAGWAEAGRRGGYYPRPGGEPANALILRKSLTGA